MLSIGVVAPLVAPLVDAQPYGNHVFLVDLAQGLERRGHAVVVYAASGSTVSGVHVEPVDVDADAQRRFLLLREHVASEAKAMQRSFERLFARVRVARHDVVSQHAFDAPAILGDASAPVLHTLHLPPMRDEVVAAARACSRALASVSHSCAQQWQAMVERTVIALPNGVPDLAIASASVEDFALMVGRISREKGIATGLRAARRANLAPVVIGEIYDEAYYRGDVLPELPGTTLQPSMPRAAVRALMARAAVTLMPVEWDEPFGLVAAEAQLAGCPIVGYRRGALPEIVAQGRGGILVAPGDEDALVDAIAAARTLDREAIRNQAIERFGMDACVDRYERVLLELADRAQ